MKSLDILSLSERLDAGEHRCGTQLLLDPEEAVVLGGALSARGRAGLDLTGAPSHGQVGDGDVLGLSGPVGHDDVVSVPEAHLRGLSGLGDRTDLIDLQEEGVGRLHVYPLAQALGVGDEQVIPHDLDGRADLLGEQRSGLEVVLDMF